MNDIPRSEWKSNIDEDYLNALIHVDSHRTRRELATQMDCDHKTIPNTPVLHEEPTETWFVDYSYA